MDKRKIKICFLKKEVLDMGNLLAEFLNDWFNTFIIDFDKCETNLLMKCAELKIQLIPFSLRFLKSEFTN